MRRAASRPGAPGCGTRSTRPLPAASWGSRPAHVHDTGDGIDGGGPPGGDGTDVPGAHEGGFHDRSAAWLARAALPPPDPGGAPTGPTNDPVACFMRRASLWSG